MHRLAHKMSTKYTIIVIHLTFAKKNTDAIMYIRLMSNFSNSKLFNQFNIKYLEISDLNDNEIMNGDIFIFNRGQIFLQSCTKLINHLYDLKKIIIFDVDDYILNVPSYSKSIVRNFNSYTNLKNFHSNIKKFDLIFVTTNFLKKIFKIYNKNIKVVENSIEKPEINKSVSKDNDIINILLTSSDSLKLNTFKNSFLDALKDIKKKYKDRVKIILQGKFNNVNLNEEYIDEHYGYLSLDEYFKFIREKNIHIGLVPLAGEEDPDTLLMHSSKSNIKFIEFASHGICGIYSNVEPYRDIVSGKEGIVIDNTYKNWYGAISKLIENKPLRQRIITHSNKKYLSRYTKARTQVKLKKNINLLIDGRKKIDTGNRHTPTVLLLYIKILYYIELFTVKSNFAKLLIKENKFKELFSRIKDQLFS